VKKRAEGVITEAVDEEFDENSVEFLIPVVLKWAPVVPVVPVVARPVVVPAPVVTWTPNLDGSAVTLKQF